MNGHEWYRQARQFPPVGMAGLGYQDLHPTPDITVHALTWRHRRGWLLGILYHYPHDIGPVGPEDRLIAAANGGVLERAGNVNVLVHPDWQRRGIGLRLTLEADRRWGPLPLDQQDYTPAGRRLRARLEANRSSRLESPC